MRGVGGSSSDRRGLHEPLLDDQDDVGDDLEASFASTSSTSSAVSSSRLAATRALRDFEAASRAALAQAGSSSSSSSSSSARDAAVAKATRAAESVRVSLATLSRETAALPSEELRRKAEPLRARLCAAFEAQVAALEAGLREAMASDCSQVAAGKSTDSPFGDGSVAPGRRSQKSNRQNQSFGQDGEGQDVEQLRLQEQQRMEQRLLRERAELNQEDLAMRESEFSQLQQNVWRLNDISREVATLVHAQGEDVEEVATNAERANDGTRAGLEELRKTAMYRRKINPVTCTFASVLALLALALIILIVTGKI
mmetsp:Transcript_17720/g.34895  ORF Transcript_17720/g.34895 Transcript_17720/m.34895 type:complete len:312 (+) Transcript_17720:147-1082(+)|eukprot:CAMPEP_0171498716 /NCGR_PEP_ID=MMETSP0958-20121227/8009_1 /TAXON_ID=87120 /ORGANISM="Aurantiochytrium limacinum, Strain ATCCMYA-1381" /LENGTH=311 /DNA_ID=CAMNT_0012033155 /DNA_START=130 /DNA_END=1065 /DNA_ORIENTATION=-